MDGSSIEIPASSHVVSLLFEFACLVQLIVANRRRRRRTGCLGLFLGALNLDVLDSKIIRISLLRINYFLIRRSSFCLLQPLAHDGHNTA